MSRPGSHDAPTHSAVNNGTRIYSCAVVDDGAPNGTRHPVAITVVTNGKRATTVRSLLIRPALGVD